MGFKFYLSQAGLREDLAPCLAAVGKAIGTGVPVSVLVGKPHILIGLEKGRVVEVEHLVATLWLAAPFTLAQLARADYERLIASGEG